MIVRLILWWVSLVLLYHHHYYCYCSNRRQTKLNIYMHSLGSSEKDTYFRITISTIFINSINCIYCRRIFLRKSQTILSGRSKQHDVLLLIASVCSKIYLHFCYFGIARFEWVLTTSLHNHHPHLHPK